MDTNIDLSDDAGQRMVRAVAVAIVASYRNQGVADDYPVDEADIETAKRAVYCAYWFLFTRIHAKLYNSLLETFSVRNEDLKSFTYHMHAPDIRRAIDKAFGMVDPERPTQS